MSTLYKVWIQIEEVDEKCGHYSNARKPELVDKFTTLTEAKDLQEEILTLYAAPVTDEERSNGPKHS